MEQKRQSVGDTLRILRKEMGLSQQKLADRAGVSQTTIDKIEKGQIQRPKFLPEIARALGVALSTIDPNTRLIETVQPEGVVNTQIRASRILKETSPDKISVFATYSLRQDQLKLNDQFSDDEIMNAGLFLVAQVPIRWTDRARLMSSDPDLYALYICDNSMSPEFEPGDIVIVSPSLPIAQGIACVFYGDVQHSDGGEAALIGRFVGQNEDHYGVQKWQPPHTRHLKKTVFTRAHRILLRHVR